MREIGFSKKKILESLAKRSPKRLGELSDELGISHGTIYNHLEYLKQEGLVERVAVGLSARYKYWQITDLGRQEVKFEKRRRDESEN